MEYKVTIHGTDQEYSMIINAESIDDILPEIKYKLKRMLPNQFINIKVET